MLSHQQICKHGGSQRARRVADGGLLGLSLPYHHCGCSVQVSSAVLCKQCRFLPEMVVYHSVLRKIIPEALSCPHFLLCFCFIFSFSWCSCREGQRKFDYCSSCSQSLLVTQLLAYKTAALHWWNLQMCSNKLLCMSAPQHCCVKYLKIEKNAYSCSLLSFCPLRKQKGTSNMWKT